jgi:hypothetical protein
MIFSHIYRYRIRPHPKNILWRNRSFIAFKACFKALNSATRTRLFDDETEELITVMVTIANTSGTIHAGNSNILGEYVVRHDPTHKGGLLRLWTEI